MGKLKFQNETPKKVNLNSPSAKALAPGAALIPLAKTEEADFLANYPYIQ
jgi:hypothetical protein